MKMKNLFEIEKRLLMQLNGLPLHIKLMLRNLYDELIKQAQDIETEGQEEELFWTLEDILDDCKDLRTGS